MVVNLPKTTFNFPDEFEEYINHQIGIIVGHQGFDNNILMAEGIMKVLPQVIEAVKQGEFTNIYTKKPLTEGLREECTRRMRQIWATGTYVAITRNEEETEIILREIIYPLKNEKLEIDVRGNQKKYNDCWECIEKCPVCKKEKYVQLTDENLKDLFPIGVVFCPFCDYSEAIEVEVKPSLKEMELVRPKHSSSVWREIQGEVPIKYAYEDNDLVTMTSNDGGFFDEYIDKRVPKFTDISDILNSEDTTSFPSKNYYDTSMHLIFDEFVFYWSKLLYNIYKVIRHKKEQFMFESKPSKLREIMRETTQQE